MRRVLLSFLADEAGQDLVEYALLAAFVATVSILALQQLGGIIEKVFQNAAVPL